MTKKIAVMGSGEGTNFQAIAEYFKDKDVKIVCLSDNLNARILERAQKIGIENHYLPFEENAAYFGAKDFDLIVLAGYMRILPPDVLDLGRFINLHPSLLPAFKGKDAIQRAFLAGVKVSGVTVHWVTDELDGGAFEDYADLGNGITGFCHYSAAGVFIDMAVQTIENFVDLAVVKIGKKFVFLQ